jgi:hypothetical protein
MLMAKQKVVSYCVALNCLVTAAYLSTPHSSKFARLVSDDFCLAILNLTFYEFVIVRPAKHNYNSWQGAWENTLFAIIIHY